jgi:hypothetical protein
MSYSGTQDFTAATVVGIGSGTSGTSGTSGINGTSGTSGTSGAQGTPGTSGTSGTNGAQGTPGTSGTSGTSGAQGTPGTSGTSGTSGAQGAAGTSGTSGSSGTSGGGGATAATPLIALPPIKTQNWNDSWKTWVATTGYSVGSLGVSDQNSRYSIFSLSEGEIINAVRINVSVAAAGGNCWGGIYELTTDVNGKLIMGNRLVNLGTVDASGAGIKTFTLGSPFTMPASTYGAVGIVIGADKSGIEVSTWNEAIWSGNGGNSFGDNTFYRARDLNIVHDSTLTAPVNLSTVLYQADTNGSLWILIK